MQLEQAVETFMAGYFSTCKRSVKTYAAYRTDLVQLEHHFGASTPIQMISADCLERWAQEMCSRGYAAVSVRRKFATVRVLFAYWVRRGFLDTSPLWRIRLDLGRERLLPRSLTISDMKRLIEQAWRGVDFASRDLLGLRDPRFLSVRNVAMVEILFATGIRAGELVSLGVRDWREDDSAFVVMGKGSRQRLAVMPDDRSRRAVKMYLFDRMTTDLGHDWLFVNASGKKISPQSVTRVIARLAQDAGCEARVTSHMIRHTVATLLLRYGADIRVVQEVLGHASIATTQRYTYISKEHLLSTLHVCHPNYHLNIELPSLANSAQQART